MAERPVRREQQIFTITDAAASHSSELDGRARRYAISMGIRTVCFVGAVVADGWLRWLLVVGAVFLPYTSVILANAGVRRRGVGMEAFEPEPSGELEQGRE